MVRGSLAGKLYNVPSGFNVPGGFFRTKRPTENASTLEAAAAANDGGASFQPRLEDRLPEHYMKFHREWLEGPKAAVHEEDRSSDPVYVKDDLGRVVPFQRARIPVLYPNEFHQGLWGGVGVVKGLLEPPPTKHQPNYKPPKETYWWPELFLGVVYSEVLDKHIRVTMTNRAQRLINEAHGLDNYLLKTPVNEIYSHLGLKLKREILLKLCDLCGPGEHPDVSSKRRAVLEKYGRFKVDEDVALWHGLPWNEAVHRLFVLDRLADAEDHQMPLKHFYRQELVDLLRQGYLEDVDPSVLYGEEADRGIAKAMWNSLKKYTGRSEK